MGGASNCNIRPVLLFYCVGAFGRLKPADRQSKSAGEDSHCFPLSRCVAGACVYVCVCLCGVCVMCVCNIVALKSISCSEINLVSSSRDVWSCNVRDWTPIIQTSQ